MATQKPNQPGDLDRKLSILAKGDHLNTKGEIEATSYGLFLSGIWANYQPGSGEEKPEADRETAFNTDTFTVRYRTDLDASMRLLFEGAEYDIISISPGEKRRQWTIIKAKKRN